MTNNFKPPPITEPENKGRLIVFEANASMRNFLDQLEQGTLSHITSTNAIRAAHAHFVDCAGVAPWVYQLHPGQPSR